MHVKEDFTPFKNGVIPEPSSIRESCPRSTSLTVGSPRLCLHWPSLPLDVPREPHAAASA